MEYVLFAFRPGSGPPLVLMVSRPVGLLQRTPVPVGGLSISGGRVAGNVCVHAYGDRG